MSPVMDTLLVGLVVASAVTYLAFRKVRALNKNNRDWATGHAATCDHCPAIQIREAQRQKLEIGRKS